VRRQILLGLAEVVGVHMFPGGVGVAERLDEHILIGVIETARPVEPEAAGLGAGGLGEGPGDFRPRVGVFAAHAELCGDEDHRSILASSARPVDIRLRRDVEPAAGIHHGHLLILVGLAANAGAGLASIVHE
jgi:hypothetical protein